MANPSEVEAQVRFALSHSPVRNAHFEFEQICRHLTGQFICSNILPATGPVSAGGDQGRDFETFRTYLREELGPHGTFLGLVSEGTIVFVCTTQAKDLPGKLKQDIKKVFAFGHPVHEIRAFTLESVPVSKRHQLEAEILKSYKVRLEFHDAESISNLLARPEGFWIAERFLSIPAEIRPEVAVTTDGHSPVYIDRRNRWREKDCANPTLGDFIDLRAGLREAVFNPRARGDLSFWLRHLRQLLTITELPVHIQQRARYELVVATFRGTGNFQSVDGVARTYLNESLNESDPARLEDASALLLYANTAVRHGLTSLTPIELRDWNNHLTNHIQELVVHETSHRRASLLFALGQLGLHPELPKTDVLEPNNQARMPERWETVESQSTLAQFSLQEDLTLTNESQTLSAWGELVESFDEVPLFPIQTLASMLQLLVPLWSKQAEWRRLLDLVETAVGERTGKDTLAARARDRAMKLLQIGCRIDALEEFHRAKIDWWSGKTVRGSLLAMMIIADLYLELRLPHAAKSHALAVTYIANSKGDEKLADLISAGLLMAANADYTAGAWCSALELCELGLNAHNVFIEDGIYSDRYKEMVEGSLSNLAYIAACARNIDPNLATHIGAMIDRIGAQEIIANAVNALDTKDSDFWKSAGDKELVARPFSDLGKVRHIRFSALGTDWSLITTNDIESSLMAERFAAAAQVMLVALAREDLCLVQTQIRVHIENKEQNRTPEVDRVEPLHSNDGREWVVRLSPARNSDDVNPEEIDIELLTTLTTILREVSLLPDDDFCTSLERAFERGLRHKLSPGRPYDQLVEALEPGLRKSQYITPWDCGDGAFMAHGELRWQDGPGPTYSKDKAKQLLQTRYNNLAKGFQHTVKMLTSSKEFQPTIATLRTRNWLDWHILDAIFNIVMNYRFPPDPLNPISKETQREMLEVALQPESAAAEQVPIGCFTLDKMNKFRLHTMLLLLNHWGLECQQVTPDFPAIERFLAKRYGYWDDDVPHVNPFPDSAWCGH